MSQRGLMKQIPVKPKKKDLDLLLKSELAGAVRTPALSFGDVSEKMANLDLERCEVSPSEPLHDLKGHIKNVWDLLPHHLPIEIKPAFETELVCALGACDKYRGCDYRLSVIYVCERLKSKLPAEIKELMYTLMEISRLSYENALKRSPKSILRLYNMTFLHSVWCIQIFGPNPKIGKVYGIYFHSIVAHLAEMSRLIAPSSLYTESEERIFRAIRGITRSTSNRSKESVRDVGIVRY